MKHLYLLLLLSVSPFVLPAQGIVCNPGGNLVIVTNYDGGPLNLVVDVNIPNLYIGFTSYESLQVNISGPYVNNIAGIIYAGANSNNNHCNLVIPTTTITVTSSSTVIPITINVSPPAPTPNPNGNASIICGYSCDTTTSQGGCNTVDQIEDYFLTQFPGSSIYSHHVQYGCYTTPMLLSQGGTCCSSPPVPLTLTATVQQVSCPGLCDGSITVTPQGNAPPFSFLWSNGATTSAVTGLCPGTYTVTVTDSLNNTATSSFALNVPVPLMTAFSVSGDGGNCSGSVFAIPTGGAAPYTYLWDSCGTLGGSTTGSLTGVCAGTCCVIVTDANGCTDTSCVTVPSTVGLGDPLFSAVRIYPNPSADGIIFIDGVTPENLEQAVLTDATGRTLDYRVQRRSNGAQLSLPAKAGVYFLALNGVHYRILVCSKKD